MQSFPEILDINDLLPLLVAVNPDFKPLWDDFLNQWEHEPNKPYLLALGKYARFLVNQLERDDTGNFRLLFATLESFFVKGTDFVREIALPELIETLLMFCDKSTEAKMVHYFGPHAIQSLEKINHFKLW